LNITFRPIDRWPREFTKGRRRSPFKGDYNSTMRLLERELRNASAREPIVQVALLPSDFRIDGRPYAGAQYQHPGVIVSFTKGKMPLAFPCDTYVTWIENLRAVALALDALRRVERYGVTKHAEQYRGWNALPPAGPLVTPSMTPAEAAKWICEGSKVPVGEALSKADIYRLLFRDKALSLHPDRNGGIERPEWHTLQMVKAVMDAHHRGQA
jgi:hypothetical protein